ncbi:hypothetical protein FGG78_21885 [Thioclava sp. BHET1]|nr:hypothetical protein FGG78_21885 [Thioclava sp. BHET1]
MQLESYVVLMTPLEMRLYLAGFTLLGFAISLFLLRTTFRLRRAYYVSANFLATAPIALLMSPWLYFTDISGAFFIIMLVVTVAANICLGVAYGVLSRARSYDIKGTGSWAWMGMVPIFNFVLIFAKGQKDIDTPERSRVGRFCVDPLLILVSLVIVIIASGQVDRAETKTSTATTQVRGSVPQIG